MTPFFRREQTSVQKLTPYMIFSKDQLHIILKRMNLEICEHSSFLITKSNAARLLHSYALRRYEACRTKNQFGPF